MYTKNFKYIPTLWTLQEFFYKETEVHPNTAML